MPAKLDSSGTNSSPEKPINTKIIKRRKSTNIEQTPKRTSAINSDDDDLIDEETVPLRTSPAPFRYKTPAPETQSTKYNYMIYMIAIVIIVVAVLCTSKSDKGNNPSSSKIDCSKFINMNKQFPNQDKKLFKSLKVGVEGTVNEEPPELSVFSLFSTDENLIENFMQEVIKVAKQCMNQSQDPLSLTNAQLGNKMVEDYKEELSKRHIMILRNIEDASYSTVKSLHAFCDTYNPLNAASVIFLTIRVPQSPPVNTKPVEYITNFLNQRWESLEDNIRNPLITRMVDQTFFLHPLENR